MIHLEEHKYYTSQKNIRAIPLPEIVYVPVSQHIGAPGVPCVPVGQTVLRGQVIATSDAKVFAPIHAPLSGKVTAVQDWPHPLLGTAKAIVIQSDGADTASPSITRTQKEIQKLSSQQIRKIVFEAGIVGLGGASFPTHIKLDPPKPLDSLIINAAECEPFLTSDFRLMIEKTREIVLGIEIIQQCTAIKQAYIAIEDNKPEAITRFEEALADTTIQLRVLKSQYPQGGEKQLIKAILKREVPQGKLPFDVGALVQNIATVNAIYEAVYLGKTLYERVITVSGDCLENPSNILARIGTPIRHFVSACGPLKQEPKTIVFGGPMMGLAQHSLDTPTIKNTNGVLFFSAAETKTAQEAFCIRCSRCVESCPMGLTPCLLSLASEKGKWDMAQAYGCNDCMECGLCNYVCPQKRNIVQAIKLAKIRVKK